MNLRSLLAIAAPLFLFVGCSTAPAAPQAHTARSALERLVGSWSGTAGASTLGGGEIELRTSTDLQLDAEGDYAIERTTADLGIRGVTRSVALWITTADPHALRTVRFYGDGRIDRGSALYDPERQRWELLATTEDQDGFAVAHGTGFLQHTGPDELSYAWQSLDASGRVAYAAEGRSSRR